MFRGLSWSQGPKRNMVTVNQTSFTGRLEPRALEEQSYLLFLVVFLVVFLDDFLAAFLVAMALSPPFL